MGVRFSRSSDSSQVGGLRRSRTQDEVLLLLLLALAASVTSLITEKFKPIRGDPEVVGATSGGCIPEIGVVFTLLVYPFICGHSDADFVTLAAQQRSCH